MAEIQFFATEADHESVVSALVLHYKATFVMDAGALLPLRTFSTVAQVMSAIAGDDFGPRFFVLSPEWQVEPLVFSEAVRRDGLVRYHVRGRYGGPSLDYIAKRPTLSPLGPQIVPSSLSVFPSYYLTSGEVRCPVSLQATLTMVRRVVSSGGKRTSVKQTGRPGPIAMADARRAHNQGSWLRVGEWRHEPRNAT